MSQPGSLVHSRASSMAESEDHTDDIKYIYKNKLNDTIKEEDSAMYDLSQLDITKNNLNEVSNILGGMSSGVDGSDQKCKLEELKSTYTQRRKEGRLKHLEQ